MCDLVIACERRIHGRAPAHHVGQHAIDDQVADEHAHRAAQERIDAAAVSARPHVAALLTRGRDPLEQDLPEVQHEHPGDVEAVGEERLRARVCLLLGADPAHGEHRVLGLAGEQVAAAGAAVCEQADAGRMTPLDLGAVLRVESRPSSSLSPSRPSGTPGCPRWTRAGCPPGWRRQVPHVGAGVAGALVEPHTGHLPRHVRRGTWCPPPPRRCPPRRRCQVSRTRSRSSTAQAGGGGAAAVVNDHDVCRHCVSG